MKKLKAQLQRTIFLCGISYIAGWEELLQMGKKFKNGNRQKEKATTSTKRVTICSEDDEDTSSDEEEIVNKKRTAIRQLVDELENEIENPRKRNKK